MFQDLTSYITYYLFNGFRKQILLGISRNTGVISSEFPVLSVPSETLRIILSVPPELRVPGAVI